MAPVRADDTNPGPGPSTARRQPRLTGRAVVLALVVLMLAVSWASSMRAYLSQRAHIHELRTEIAQRNDSIKRLEREKTRWQDDAYVQQQARERFGYVMPGQKTYVVLGADGKPLDGVEELDDPVPAEPATPKAWWKDAWTSVELAGHPPKPGELGPAEEIPVPKERKKQ